MSSGGGVGESVIGIAIDARRRLGPGRPTPCEECLCHDPGEAANRVCAAGAAPIVYTLDGAYWREIVVRQELVIEISAIERLMPIHEAQMFTSLRLSGYAVALPPNLKQRPTQGQFA